MSLSAYLKFLHISAPLLILTFIGLLVFSGQQHHTLIERQNAQSQLVKDSFRLQQLLTDRETGQRGFLLTGDERFLEPYHNSADQIATLVEAIATQLPAHYADNLRDIIAKRKAYFESSFELAQRSPEEVADFIKRGQGKQYMDSMRALLNEAIDSNMRDITDLQTQAENISSLENWLALAFLIITLSYALLSYRFFNTQLYQPLQALRHASSGMGIGEFNSAALHPSKLLEVEQLNDTFNKMRTVIAENHHELQTKIDQLEQQSQAKNLFMSNMSHELRTPLNGIYGILQLMEEDATDQEQHERIAIALDSTRALTGIVNDVLDLQRMAQGKITIEPKEVSSLDFIHEVERLFAAEATRKGLLFSVETAPLPHGFWVDKMRLQQVLTNIIGNAIKFTMQGHVRVHISFANHQLHVAVADSGIGMDQALIDILFEPFTQGDQSMTRVYSGAGLGLAISRQLIELMGGEIHIFSTPQKGTTVDFSIYCEAIEEAPQEDATQHSPRDIDLLRVLIVDDNIDNLFIAKEMLRPHVHKVMTAHAASKALDTLQSNSCDLGLIDIEMPQTSGLVLARQIKERYPELILIAATAFPNRVLESEEAALFSDVLTKPFVKKELLDTVKKQLS